MTILSQSRRFIFVHIPKTGGTTIKWLLSPSLQPQQDIQIGGPPGFAGPPGETTLRKHSRLEDIRKSAGEDQLESYFKFSIVRNPFTRTMSTFSFLKYKFRQFPNAEVMDGFSTVDDFVASDFFSKMGPSGMFAPQSAWLGATDKSSMDYLGHVENFEQSVADILQRLGVTSRKLEKRNSSSTQSHDSNSLSDSTADIIRNRYARDFKDFGYSIDPADCLLPPFKNI